MAVKLMWRQWWTPDAAQNIYRHTQDFTRDNLPVALATVAAGITTYDDATAAEGDVYWYAVGASLNGVEVVSKAVRVASGDGSGLGGGDPVVPVEFIWAEKTSQLSTRWSGRLVTFAEPVDWQDGDIIVLALTSDYLSGASVSELNAETTLNWTGIYEGNYSGVYAIAAYATLNDAKTWASQTSFIGGAHGWTTVATVLRGGAYEAHTHDTGATGMPDPPELIGFNSGDLVLAVGHLDDKDIHGTAPDGYTIAATDGAIYGSAISSTMVAYKTSEGGDENPAVFGGADTDEWAASTIRFVPQAVTPSTAGDLRFDAGMVVSGLTISNSDLTVISTSGGSDYRPWTPTTRKLPGTATAPFYWEFVCNPSGPAAFNGYHGVAADAIYYEWKDNDSPITHGSLGYRGNGDIWGNNSNQLVAGATTSYGASDILMMAFDPATGKLWIGKNGVWRDDPDTDPATATSTAAAGDFWVFVQGRTPDEGGTLRTKASQFSYTMPSSCVALGDVA